MTMPVVLPTLPIPYGYVVGRYLLVVGDTDRDEDSYPDATPAVGEVRFAPVVKTTIVTEKSPAVTAIPLPVTVKLDERGFIRDPSGNLGVWLVAGQYDVTFSFVGVSLPPFRLEVTGEHTADAPADLSLAAPLVPSPAVKFVVNEQIVRDTLAAHEEAEAAKVAAVQSRTDALSFRNSAGSYRTEAQTARTGAETAQAKAEAARDAAERAASLAPWVGTAAEYTALPSRDPARLYVIRAA